MLHIQFHTGILFHQVYCILDNCKSTKSQEIHLQKSQFFQRSHSKLGNNRTILCPGKRYIFRYVFLTDHHTCRMHGCMAWKPFQTLCCVNQLMNLRLFFVNFFQFRIHSKRFIYGNIQLLWNHLCDHIHLCVRHIHNTPYIPDHTSGCQCTKCNNLNNTVIPIFTPYIVNNFLSSFKTEIHINIRHGYTFRIQETLKQKIIPYRVKLSNS